MLILEYLQTVPQTKLISIKIHSVTKVILGFSFRWPELWNLTFQLIKNELGLSSPEQSTDSTNIDEVVDECRTSKRSTNNVRERYKHIRQQ